MNKIRQMLLDESKKQGAVELGDLFEGFDLSEDVKTQFSTVFESNVNKRAVELAESKINEIIEKADEYTEQQAKELKESMSSQLNDYLDYNADEYMKENQLAVENGIKVQLFDSLMENLKELFVEHNITVPDDKVDVVAELEEETAELSVTLDGLLKENKSKDAEIETLNRKIAISEKTKDLTESQRERVAELSESVPFNESFDSKLSSLVSFVESNDKDSDDEDGKKDKKDKKDDKDDKQMDEGLNYGNTNTKATNHNVSYVI